MQEPKNRRHPECEVYDRYIDSTKKSSMGLEHNRGSEDPEWSKNSVKIASS